MNDSSLPVTRQETAPAQLNLGNAFDLALPLADRSEYLMRILSLAAELTVQRDEDGNSEAYEDPEFRQQEVRRRTLKGIEDLRQAANMLELRWAMENGHQTWTDADGAEVSLLEVIEHQMPDEEQRKSSGRARQVAAFVIGESSAVAAFREQGIPDQRIAQCARSGMSSVLGIVSSTRRKLEEAYPEQELHDLYEELIEAAAETTNLDGLKRKCRQMVDPTDTPPPPILYSIENDGISERTFYFLAKLTQDQISDVLLRRLGDVLEEDKLLPEAFVRYWRSFSSVPAGQG